MRLQWAALFLAVAAPAAAGTIAIRAGALIDPELGAVKRDQVVLVEDGKIRAIGAALAIPSGATRSSHGVCGIGLLHAIAR